MEPRLPIKTSAERLHAAYCAEMSYDPADVPLTMASHFAWQAFADEFTPDDLRALIRHIRTKGRMARSLLARHLITGVNSIEFAHEDLAEAKARARTKPATAKQKILTAIGRPEVKPDVVTTPGAVMEGDKAFADFRKWRKETGL